MSPESRRLAGLLLVILPTVIVGGASIVRLLYAGAVVLTLGLVTLGSGSMRRQE